MHQTIRLHMSVRIQMMIAANESAAVAAVRTFNTAEISYAATFPGTRLYLHALRSGRYGKRRRNDRAPGDVDRSATSVRQKERLRFRLSGCDGTPSARYSIAAEPANPAAGTRAFCSDESAVIHFSADGKAESCLQAGTPLQ